MRGFIAGVSFAEGDPAVLDGWDAEDSAYVCGYNSGGRCRAAAKRRATRVAVEVTS